MSEPAGRRPLKVRSAKAATKLAKALSEKNITPNQISILSIVFAALAAACLMALPHVSGHYLWILPLCAALLIQCRLLCNLFDGMVAVEGGKGTASGELFNDIPDRIADPLLLIAAGYSISGVDWASTLGWAAALLAVMTAYIRTLALSIGAPANFAGPMAKQHRMAILTVACVLTAMQPAFIKLIPAAASFWSYGSVMLITLIIICVGCILTCYKRTLSAYRYLENKV
ncbi:CDP-alcohol phosphatidyltransferase family protein [Psychrobacter sp. FDAARGOS_221]|uniref:CDP-alcohol phosphatidyltransferase family protein n=1 Tax=Psychrobacter sp. FDAARGOS_221 TaxID=1975705 RepID=UPI000BB5449F|nr:CDP-alcohol phosphatidyltransferase family protein [Psychrobacter sp. FDAARGOS_221]PNK61551.1 CDP-alcohol phosphatidyltransferase family protein [Psychrobacter sp. FDAARGOS_221]